MKIKNKKQFYELAQKGLCGNTPRMWMDVDDYLDDKNAPREVGIRYTSVSDKRFVPRIGWYQLHLSKGILKNRSYIISEIPYTNAIDSLQGELSWFDGRWVLYYTHDMAPMREALKNSGKHVYGLQAINLIKGYCSASEFSQLMELFDRYTDGLDYPVIEFAVMRYPMGRLNQCLVIWEIRNGY